MSTPTKYFLQNIGIGDLTFFCGTVLLDKTKGDTIMVKISEFVLNEYRNGSKQYEQFCIDYIRYILSDYNVIHLEPSDDTNSNWGVNYDTYDRVMNTPEINQHFKNKFLIDKTDRYKDSIVIVTKVRDLFFDTYKQISKQLCEVLNGVESELILVGEREIIYDGEYSHHGQSKIYSIYSDLKKRLNQNKLVDYTKDIYTANTITLDEMLKNLNIIYNSKLTIVFGGGGFFCTSLFNENLLTLTNDEIVKYFNQRQNRDIYYQFDKFLEKLKNV